MDLSRRRWWVLGALAVAVAAVFAQVARFGFLTYDDPVYVSSNPLVQQGLSVEGFRWAFGIHESNWHPLTWLSLMLDATIGGPGPAAFHVTNAVLHLAASIFLFLALARMTRAQWRPLLVALLFAVHPLHVESVAWIAERKDVVSAVFWFLTMLAYAAWVERPSRVRYAFVVLALALGLMAKPMLVTLPFVLLLLDFWPLRRALAPSLLVEKVPLLLLTAASSIVTLIAQRRGGSVTEYPFLERVTNAIVSCAAYLGQTVWPSGLSFFYPHPRGGSSVAVVLLAAALLVGITVLVLRFARRFPYLPVGWLWYLGTLIPVVGIVQVGVQARADRYTYIPLVGLFLIAAWGAGSIVDALASRTATRLVAGASGLAVVVLAVLARRQAGYWRDSVTLYQRALELRSDNPVAHVNLATALLDRGDVDGATMHAREALRLAPGHPEPPRVLGNALARQGKLDEAVAVYRKAVADRPNDALLRSNLGAFLGDQGKLDEAEAEIREAIRLAPDDSGARLNLGVVFARRRRYEDAAREFAEALRLDPRSEEARVNLERARTLAAKPR
jgi:Flp pilus assembly protein TadD